MIKKVRETLICDKCGREMEWTGMRLECPTLYRHSCQCGHREYVRECTYPNEHFEKLGVFLKWENIDVSGKNYCSND